MSSNSPSDSVRTTKQVHRSYGNVVLRVRPSTRMTNTNRSGPDLWSHWPLPLDANLPLSAVQCWPVKWRWQPVRFFSPPAHVRLCNDLFRIFFFNLGKNVNLVLWLRKGVTYFKPVLLKPFSMPISWLKRSEYLFSPILNVTLPTAYCWLCLAIRCLFSIKIFHRYLSSVSFSYFLRCVNCKEELLIDSSFDNSEEKF